MNTCCVYYSRATQLQTVESDLRLLNVGLFSDWRQAWITHWRDSYIKLCPAFDDDDNDDGGGGGGGDDVNCIVESLLIECGIHTTDSTQLSLAVVANDVECGCFDRLKVDEITAAKDTEFTRLLQNCDRLKNELASVRKVRLLFVQLQ